MAQILLIFLMLSSCGFFIPAGIFDSTTPLENRTYTVIGPVDEKGCDFQFLGLGGPRNGSISQILSQTLTKYKADAVISGTVESVHHYLLIITIHCTRLKGTAIRFTKATDTKQ
jgi:hypothetical protein